MRETNNKKLLDFYREISKLILDYFYLLSNLFFGILFVLIKTKFIFRILYILNISIFKHINPFLLDQHSFFEILFLEFCIF